MAVRRAMLSARKMPYQWQRMKRASSIDVYKRQDGSKYIWVFALAAFAVFAFYCIQGWAMMKRMSWILLIIVNAIIYVPYSGKN